MLTEREGNTTGLRRLRVRVERWAGDPASLHEFEADVHVREIPLAPPPVDPESFLPLLTPDERERADRYKVSRARVQFLIGRGLLRTILGVRLGIDPGSVVFDYTGSGKPILPSGQWQFNVSHTDGFAIIAIGQVPVGVDVERVRALANPDGLVGRFFSAAERSQYAALAADDRRAGFFRGWTSKEALLKAAGLSVAYLDDFDVDLDPRRPASLLAARLPALASSDWSLADWSLEPEHVAALAVEGAWQIVLDRSR
jgi:4'-phosphopantetheinyl transferase